MVDLVYFHVMAELPLAQINNLVVISTLTGLGVDDLMNQLDILVLSGVWSLQCD